MFMIFESLFLASNPSSELGALGSCSPHNTQRLTGRESGMLDRVDRLWVATKKRTGKGPLISLLLN